MNAKLWFRFILMGLMLSALVLAGCDDGDDGKNGKSAYDIAVDNGYEGTFEEYECLVTPGCGDSDVPTTAEPEQCAVCHSDVEATHAATGVPVISGQDGNKVLGGNYTITFNLAVDGVGTNEGYQLYRVYKTYDDPTNPEYTNPAAITTNTRDQLFSLRGENPGDCTDYATCEDSDGNSLRGLLAGFSSTADGAFTVVIPDAEYEPNAAYTVVVRSVESATEFGDLEPAFVLIEGATPLRDLVSDDGESVGCASCHGASASSLFDHYLVAGNECQACHAIYGRNADLYTLVNDVWVNQSEDALPGSNFTEYIHGIHNSHNMPAGEYYRSSSTQWSIGYPSDMINCSSCHVSDEQLAAAVEAPVSFYLCMTCHQSWDGFVRDGEPIFDAGNFHRGADVTTDCMSCHGAVPSLDEVGDFHNAILDSARSNSFYRGENISLENPDDVDFEITGIASDGSIVSFTWTASDSSGAVDPCNMDTANGPTFQDLGAYLAYAKGDDWVNEFVRDAPGQPAGSAGLFDDLATICDANVAYTTGLVLNPDATSTYADRVLLALGGKPFAEFSSDLPEDALLTGDYSVRVSSPTQAFDPATGDFLADRRDAVNNDKCLGCHQGTLYQHGGDRVDNEQLCVICHNPAASDKNVRLDTFQVVNEDGTVNTDATYDGRNAETYDMRTMLHAIHGVEARLATGGKPWVVYRGRGIYGFGLEDTPLPEGWPADGETVNGSTNGGTTPHNWVVVHYPKAVNDCDACHNDGQYEAADQTKAVGVTDDAGFDWPDQSDDIIIGPSAAACTACHAGAAQRSHAQSNGYRAKVTKDEMLDKAN